jgi:hypothetical protein
LTPDFVERGGSLDDLRLALATEGDAPLLLYVMSSTRVGDGRIDQHGSGPNLEGGVATLCTCKHHVRTWKSVAAGTWMAGVTSGARGADVRQALFYLARIERTFASHRELWAALPDAARRAKSMSDNYLGDLFEPLPGAATDPYAATSYRPVTTHSHITEAGDATELDRDRCHVPGVRPRLVAFDPAATFAWSRPVIRREAGAGRGARWTRLADFIDSLTEVTS